MEKDARIARLQARLAAINCERAEIEAELAALTNQERMGPAETGKGEVPGTLGPVLTTSEKIALFRSLFRGRADVFPVRWENPKTGKSGYSPACDNEWRHGLCGKAPEQRPFSHEHSASCAPTRLRSNANASALPTPQRPPSASCGKEKKLGPARDASTLSLSGVARKDSNRQCEVQIEQRPILSGGLAVADLRYQKSKA